MSTIFFVSDTHFHHKNILKFESDARPFESVEKMNEVMVQRWNRTVSPSDKVYHLGDVSFVGDSDDPLKIVDRLNGKKRLILGNHDRFSVLDYAKYFDKIHGVRNLEGYWLTHVPMHEFSMQHRVKLNIHGHIHSKNIDDPRYLNVCVEVLKYLPISFDEVKEMMK